MSLGHINLITPPDKLFNINVSYLLIKPTNEVKMKFHQILSRMPEDINVYILDDEVDVEWMLSVSRNVDSIIIDIDNCDPQTKLFLSALLIQPNAFYMTNDETTPWNLISRNRIYDLDWIIESLEDEFNDDYDDEEEDEDD